MNLLPFLKPATDLLDKLIVDKDERAQAKEKLEQSVLDGVQAMNIAQARVNEAEAKHKSMFVAGGRPFIMWICGFGLGYNVIVQPILSIWLDVPDVKTDLLYPTLMGMLGMGGLRTYEKLKGVSREVDPKGPWSK